MPERIKSLRRPSPKSPSKRAKRYDTYKKARNGKPAVMREEPTSYGKQPEKKSVEQPFAENIRAGKKTYVYDAHTSHTKVPPEGIAKLIEYYTEPGNVILDPFCGSGMTGVA